MELFQKGSTHSITTIDGVTKILTPEGEVLAGITEKEMEMGMVEIGEGKFYRLVEHEFPPVDLKVEKKPMPKMQLV